MVEAWVAIANTASSNEKRDGDWNGEVDWKRITEALDENFTGKLAENVANV